MWALESTTVSERRVCRASAAVSIAFFISSLLTEAVYVDGEAGGILGWQLLVFGVLGLFIGFIAWLANPALALALGLMGFGLSRFAIIPAVISFALSLGFLLCSGFPTSVKDVQIKITGYGCGYWLWVASTIAAVLGCILALCALRRSRRKGPIPNPCKS